MSKRKAVPPPPVYSLEIRESAIKSWMKLDLAVKKRFIKKLQFERLITPRVDKDALHGLADTYKIKITTPQYRLAYHVNDQDKILTILAVSTRDDVYDLFEKVQSAKA